MLIASTLIDSNNLLSGVIELETSLEDLLERIALLSCSLCCYFSTPLQALELTIDDRSAYKQVKFIQKPVSDLLQVCLRPAVKVLLYLRPMELPQSAWPTDLHTL